MIGFVHNPDSDPLLFFSTAHHLLELLSAEAGRRTTRLAGDLWLVVISPGEISYPEAYRTTYSQLRKATDFKKILMVFGDGVSRCYRDEKLFTRMPTLFPLLLGECTHVR